MLLFLQLPLLAAAFQFPTPVADEEAIRGVLRRLPPWINNMISGFEFSNGSEKEDGARIIPSNGGGIYIQATSGPAVLYAINYYLRQYCHTQITWDGNTYGERCDLIEEELFFKAPMVRYFGNPCTFGYSFVWWKWPEWERFIDWLALNGFNAMLAPIGQEALWRDVFTQQFGVSRDSLNHFFTGPAFLPWNRMGNLKGYGGPLSDQFMDEQLELNKLIVARLASLGITPILPTFAGFVPDSLLSHHSFPRRKAHELKNKWGKKFVKAECWDGFNETYSCLNMVKPGDELYSTIGKAFMEKQLAAYGRYYHVYSADPMNEMSARLDDLTFLQELSNSIHAGCAGADSECIWVLQSWAFNYDKWPKQSVKAFLGGVPPAKALVLDLYGEHSPQYVHTRSFYGHPFVLSMLHNFGGNTEIRGNLKHLNKNYQIALTTPGSMVGGGLTMEAIHQNYVQYQFMIDRMWSGRVINLENWVEAFVKSRYQTDNGTIVRAWKRMVTTFYSEPAHAGRFENFIYKRPKLTKTIRYWFPMEHLVEIVQNFTEMKDFLWDNHLFRMDYNDVHRELMQVHLGNDIIMAVAESAAISDDVQLSTQCARLQKLLIGLEDVANYDFNKWEEAAKSWGKDREEENLFAQNARALLSIWGPQGQNLDYAHRSWKGLLKRYYAPRWKFLCSWMQDWDRRYIHNVTAFNELIFKTVERPFVINERADFFFN